jgi:Eukaryotic aspartyl protease
MLTLMRYKTFFNDYGTVFGPCDTSLYPSVYLYIEGYTYEIKPENYVFDAQDPTNTNMCIIGFAQNSYTSYWLVGNTFLKNFYSVWDDEEGRLAFAPHITSQSKVEKYYSLP